MKNIFFLAVAAGAILHGPGFEQRTITEVPDDAQDQWEKGEFWLGLKPDQGEFLKQYSKTKLEHILNVRRLIGYSSEIQQLEQAISTSDKPEKIKQVEPAVVEEKKK